MRKNKLKMMMMMMMMMKDKRTAYHISQSNNIEEGVGDLVSSLFSRVLICQER